MFTSTEIETAIIEALPVTCTLWRDDELAFVWEDKDGIECEIEVRLVGPDFIPVNMGHIIRPRSMEQIVEAVDACLRKGCLLLYVVQAETQSPEPQVQSALNQIQQLSRELDALKNKPRQIDAGLRCIDGRGLEAADLMHYRISKRSSAKLKLVFDI